MTKTRHTAIDLFCGCGGFSVGFIRGGWEVVAAIDSNPEALASYYVNLCDINTKIIGTIPKDKAKYFETPGTGYLGTGYGGWRWHQEPPLPPPVRAIFLKNILEVTGWDMLDAAGVDRVDVVIGSPPCQSYSNANTRKKKNDFRDFLMFEYARMVLEIAPKTFVLENVPQVIKAKLPDGRDLIDIFGRILKYKDWELYYEIQGMYPEFDKNFASASTQQQCSLTDF